MPVEVFHTRPPPARTSAHIPSHMHRLEDSLWLVQVKLIYWGPTSVLVSWATGTATKGPQVSPVNAFTVGSHILYGKEPGNLTENVEMTANNYVCESLSCRPPVSPCALNIFVSMCWLCISTERDITALMILANMCRYSDLPEPQLLGHLLREPHFPLRAFPLLPDLRNAAASHSPDPARPSNSCQSLNARSALSSLVSSCIICLKFGPPAPKVMTTPGPSAGHSDGLGPPPDVLLSGRGPNPAGHEPGVLVHHDARQPADPDRSDG